MENGHTLIGDTSLKGWNFPLSFASFLGCSQTKMTPFLLHYRANQENKQGKQPWQTHLIVFPEACRYNILLSYFLMLQQVFLCWICSNGPI